MKASSAANSINKKNADLKIYIAPYFQPIYLVYIDIEGESNFTYTIKQEMQLIHFYGVYETRIFNGKINK